MSRYTVNRILRDIYVDLDQRDAYRADPAAFVAGWRATHPDTLSDDEATAVADADYATLYAAGIHPYLVWGFCESTLVPGINRAELVAAYRDALLPLGYPDVSTTPVH
jgi:hypothetical protein